MTSQAERQAQIAAWVSTLVNVALTIGKGAVGWLTGSRALMADAVHSAADVVGSVAVVIGLRIARKPPDSDHPYGHGRAELISAAIVAGFLVLAGLQVGYDSARALFKPATEPRWVSALAAAVAIVVKEILFQYNIRLGRRLHSKSLVASAYDHRSDVVSSIAALAGILLSLAGMRLQVGWLLHMDPVAGMVVALLVLRMGYHIAGESLQMLMDRVVEGGELEPYRQAVQDIPGVERVDDIRVRDHGRYVVVDVKISVNARITVEAGHDIAVDVKQRLKDDFPRVSDVLVHVNPFYADGDSAGPPGRGPSGGR
ncbi:MAG: cation diffusion facilitator family transporter [Alicyclobacillus sp.]|nr:cation diffusion facilitator family transporter [Alicyclobacillus sp.]